MTKNWQKFTAGKNFSGTKNFNWLDLSLCLHKGRLNYRRSLQFSKENIQHQVQTLNFLIFFYFCVSFWLSWLRIRIPNTDRDPLTWLNPAPGSVSLPQSTKFSSVPVLKIKFVQTWGKVKELLSFIELREDLREKNAHYTANPYQCAKRSKMRLWNKYLL